MRAVRVAVSLGLMIALAGVLGAQPLRADAGAATIPTAHGFALANAVTSNFDFSNDAFDIEAYDTYCPGGGTSCIASSGATTDSQCYFNGYICPGLRFADAESYGFFNGATYGTPAAVYVECDVNTDYGWEEIRAQTTSDPIDYPGFHSGVISGKSTLLDWYPSADMYGPEGNPSQVSSQNFSVFDSAWQTRASVTGLQNTDNQDDSLNAGSIRISMYGRIYTLSSTNETLRISSTEQQDSSGNYYFVGAVSCTAGGPHAYDLQNAGYSPYSENYSEFEGEMESSNQNEYNERHP